MLMLEDCIKEIIVSLVKSEYDIELEPSKIRIDTPPNPDMGDVAVPIGFMLTKSLKRNPFEIVTELAKKAALLDSFEKAEPAKPGFLNLFLSVNFIKSQLDEILFNKNALDFPEKEKTILLEYVSANPTGPLHIGHGRWAALGDSIARLLKKAGYKVMREFYVNDAGKQIKNLKASVEALRKGEPVPEDGYQGEYVKEAVNSELEPNDFFLEKQKQTLKNFQVEFDCFFSERTLYKDELIPKSLNLLQERGFLEEKEGAKWFKSTDFGDDKDRVLVKSDGSYTYFAPDIAYHLTKIERGADKIVDLLGADHHGYVNRITAAVLALSEKKVEFECIIGQMVNLFRGGEPVRMSKRTGEMITLEEVIEEIGSDALRYILVSRKHSQTIDFDLEEVKKQSKENPVFYIQYAFARINSIMRKLDKELDLNEIKLSSLEESEKQLLMKVLQFKKELYFSAEEMEPHRLALYLLDLAGLFHRFYEKNRVLDNGVLIEYRVFIIQVVAKVLKEGLALLGIDSPERM